MGRRLPVALALLALLAPAIDASASEDAVPPFLLQWTAEAPGGAHDGAQIGTAAAATYAYDVGLDAPKPPPPPGGAWVALFLDGPGDGTSERLARSLVPTDAGASWTLRVDASGSAGSVALAWDAAQLAELPPELTIVARRGDDAIDLYDAEPIRFAKPEGLWSTSLTLSLERVAGTPPEPPVRLRATHGALPGNTRLSWEEPDDGGHRVRAYHVYRAIDDGPFAFLASTNATAFLASGERAPSTYRYAVTAINRLGEGDAAMASILATGLPAALADPGPGAGETRSTLAERDAALPPLVVDQPATDPGVGAHGSPQVNDPRQYELILRAPVAGEQRFAVFTATPLPQAGADAPELPGARLVAPTSAAGFGVDARDRDADGAPDGAVVRARVAVGDEAWSDALALGQAEP